MVRALSTIIYIILYTIIYIILYIILYNLDFYIYYGILLFETKENHPRKKKTHTHTHEHTHPLIFFGSDAFFCRAWYDTHIHIILHGMTHTPAPPPIFEPNR